MSAIEKHLHEHFASLQDADDVAVAAAPTSGMLGDSIPETLAEPFARVNAVVANSPADAAGLKAGDEVRNFGYVNRQNHDELKKVAECVQGNEGVSYLLVSPLRSTGGVFGEAITNLRRSKGYSSRYRGQPVPARDKSSSST